MRVTFLCWCAGAKRGLFSEIIRAAKGRWPADCRCSIALKVGAELAVRDIGALLSVFCVRPIDALFTGPLRCGRPLFSWSEQEIFHAGALPRAKGRICGKSLRKTDRPLSRDAEPCLRDLRGQVDFFLRP